MSLLIPLIVFSIASVITGIAGFGLGLISMGVLSLLLSLRYANLIITFVGCIQVVFILIQVREHIKIAYLLPLALGVAVGAPLGVFALASFDEHLLKRILGGFILFYVVYDLWLQDRIRFTVNRWSGIGFGFAAGALGGAFSVGGPPAIMYLTSQKVDKYVFKASIAGLLVALIAIKIPFFLINGLLKAEDLPIILLFLIPGVGGVLVGMKIFSVLPSRVFKIIVHVLLVASGAMLLIKG